MENAHTELQLQQERAEKQRLAELLAEKEKEIALLREELESANNTIANNIEQTDRSEKRFRDLFNFGLALICTHDANGVVLAVNPAICKVLGYNEEELVGRNIGLLIPPNDRARFKENYLDIINRDGVAKGVFTIITKTGGKVYLLYQNYKVEEPGAEPYIIGFSQDITERRDAEEALRRSEQKYRSIIENMNLGLLEVDNDERIIYANQSFCDMCGYTVEELLGKVASTIFTSGENIFRLREINKKRATGISDAYEMAVRNKWGDPKWWLISGAPLLDRRDNMVGSIGIHLDITKQKVLEHKLMEAKVEAEESARAKELFLTNMSHEIRTPMNAIMGMGRQLQKTELSKQQQFYVDTINTASSNLLVIIDDILDLSKIESGRLTLQHTAFNLASLIDKCVFIMGEKAAEKGISISKKIDGELSQVFKGDPQRLGQVVNNLLSNAVKFTEKGGVTLECSVLQDKENRQVAQFTVKDTGLGMSKDFLKIIFHKFSQEDEGVVRKYGGTGLGMSISKHLVEAMGGKISVESEKGKGTTVHFIVSLEKGRETDLPKVKLTETDENILDGVRILLVEDNEMNRMVANTVLVQYGAVIEEAFNGLEAVNMMRKNKYDVVLMDIRMPVMDGIESAKIIREEISRDIPIIALTANVVKGEKEKCMNVGMNEFVAKPFDEANLVQMIAKYAGRNGGNVAKSQDAGAAKTETDAKLYDLAKLWDISRGKHAFVEKMINIFITETSNAVKDIRAAFESKDLDKIRSVAHKIKPSLYNLSINSIREDILHLELFGKGEQPEQDGLAPLVEKVEKVLTSVIEQMKKDPVTVPAS